MVEKADTFPVLPEMASIIPEGNSAPVESAPSVEQVLLKYLFQNIREAVLVIGNDQKIVAWNRSASLLFGTAIQSEDLGSFLKSIELQPRQNQDEQTPESAITTAIVERRQMNLVADLIVAHRPMAPVEVRVIPMVLGESTQLGSMLIVHDATYKVNLQQQVQQLMEKTSCDILTGVANRGEFERVLAACCQTSNASNSEFSLIISDIDHFKRINDDYGHDVGDQALIAFATILNRSIRTADLLCRYGGEEFVIICHGCNAQAAIDCAEKIRKRLERTPLTVLRQKHLTASFGVAQFQPGDDSKSIFVRADQALLRAKEMGRNQVVLGEEDEEGKVQFVGGASVALNGLITSKDVLASRELTSGSPIEVLAAKLDGFVHEYQAQILSVDPNRVLLQTNEQGGLFRRGSDRRIAFQIDLRFQDLKASGSSARGFAASTKVLIAISAVKRRDRRSTDIAQKAEAVLKSVLSYLMLEGDSNTSN